MPADMPTSLPLILIGVLLLVIAAFLLLRLNRKAKVIKDDTAPAFARDVLDEGAERARRNQTLIDAAPAAIQPEAPSPALAPAPAPASAPSPAAARSAVAADDLTRIKGVGPKLAVLLGELGITAYAQIAAWSDKDVERIDAELGRFKGRIARDQWIAQAKLLGASDEAGFAAKFGQNG